MTLNIEASREQNVIYGDVSDNEGNVVSFTIYNEEGKIILCFRCREDFEKGLSYVLGVP